LLDKYQHLRIAEGRIKFYLSHLGKGGKGGVAMSQSYVSELFGNKIPVIAMAHIPALPGTPRYDERGGMQKLIDQTRSDVECLVENKVDAIMFCNEDDRPYEFEAGPEQVAAMTRVVNELRPDHIPFGVDFLWDPIAALCIAAATGGSFIREVLTGTYESDMGLWSPKVGKLMRLRRNIHAEGIRIFFNITPEFGSTIGSRTIAERAKTSVVSSLADAILISGTMAGEEPELSALQEAKGAVGPDIPVFLNTGAKATNIEKYLKIADGVIVGSTFKVDGYTWNAVDPKRVAEFMNVVEKYR
jgi:membrane complex biogenesis BtpA family protein